MFNRVSVLPGRVVLATERQVAFMAKLAQERGIPAPSGLSVGQASAWIDRTLALPRVEPVKARQAVEAGMYRVGSAIFKVQLSAVGRPYAKQLVRIGGDRLNEADQVVHWEFQYVAGAIQVIQPEHRLTLDEAKAFGVKHGVCCVCGAPLVDAKSVERGIGPVCAKKV